MTPTFNLALKSTKHRPHFEENHLLNLSLHYSRIREACSVRNDKMSLVPRRVIPHIFFQKSLHKFQLIVPQFVLLANEEDNTTPSSSKKNK